MGAEGKEKKKLSLGRRKVMRMKRGERNSEEKLHDSGVDESKGETLWPAGRRKKQLGCAL